MKTLDRLLLVGLTALALVCPLLTPAKAWSTEEINLCFRISVAYTDSAQGTTSPDTQEDYFAWTTPNFVYLRGALATVRKNGSIVWGPTHVAAGDFSGSPGVGCTGSISVPSANGNYSVTLETFGAIQAQTLRSLHRTIVDPPETTTNFTISQGEGSYNITVSMGSFQPQWRVYAALAHALWYNFPSGNTDTAHVAWVGDNPPGGDGGCSTGACYISSSNSFYTDNLSSGFKFVFTHEFGHLIGDVSTNGKAVDFMGACSDWNFNDGDDCDAGGSHSVVSKEASHCALTEGFAHFYAAATWNKTSETDCYFEYWTFVLSGESQTPRINCESSGVDAPFDLQHMENHCESNWSQNSLSGTSWEGMSSELDWLRTLWDMRTGTGTTGCTTTRPTFSNILSWIRDSNWSSGWSDLEKGLYTYTVLNTEANTIGSYLDTCWDAARVANGINHPYTP